jgi:hypothetical protein
MFCRPDQTVSVCERARLITRFHRDEVEFHVVEKGIQLLVN